MTADKSASLNVVRLAVPFCAALLDEGGGWLVRFVHPLFAYLKIAGFVTLELSLALLVGVICVVGWAARLGFLADLLSKPVLVGYLVGIAVIMMIGQLGRLIGARLPRQVRFFDGRDHGIMPAKFCPLYFLKQAPYSNKQNRTRQAS